MTGGGLFDPLLWFYQKYVFQRKGEVLVYCDFYYYHKSQLSLKFTEILQFFQKICRFSKNHSLTRFKLFALKHLNQTLAKNILTPIFFPFHFAMSYKKLRNPQSNIFNISEVLQSSMKNLRL